MNLRGMGVGVRPPQLGPAAALLQHQYVNLAAGAALRVDTSRRLIASLIVNVTVGALDVWLSDHPVGSGDPDWRFIPCGPQQLWLPPNDYVVTIVGNRPVNRGVLILLGP